MTPLAATLAARIRESGPLRFGEVVDAALYDPHHGFYATRGQAGRRGDFLTSPEVGPLFGAVVARALASWWARLGEPARYTVVECGAGPGTLARAVLAAATGPFADALDYVTVEQSGPQRAQHPAGVRTYATLAEVPDPPIVGAVLANELLDNLPFDLVERRGGVWRDVLVDVDAAGALVEVLGPEHQGDDLATIAAADGTRLPVQRAAAAFVRDARARVGQGDVVVIDYARDRAALATVPWTHWVRTYRAHERGGPPLAELGTQDITCDVAVDALIAAVGAPAEVASQADFLAAHGMAELVAEGRAAWQAGAAAGGLAALRGRSRVREAEALADPDGLGGFTVVRWLR